MIAYFGGNHLGVPGSVQLSNATPTYYYEAEGVLVRIRNPAEYRLVIPCSEITPFGTMLAVAA